MPLRVYGNRPLKTLPGDATRPTASRVREAVFNIWQGQVEGCVWLDLCAGIGAMGAEALGRGAARVIGIEQARPACQVIRENWQRLARADQSFEVLAGDVRYLLPMAAEHGPFDLIYFDPPYASTLYELVLPQISALPLLQPTGQIAVEHQAKIPIPVPPDLDVVGDRRYGHTGLTFLTLKPDASPLP